jgi:adenine phosphoribosyltransferase
MSELDLAHYIRSIPNFPRFGVRFRDITPLLSDPDAFRYVCEQFVHFARDHSAEVVVGIESRGFLFAAPIALHLGLPFIPIRKAGKLPWTTYSIEYQLEYGTGQLDIHRDALQSGQRAIVVDDLLATGGTARAAARLVEKLGGVVAGLCFVVELSDLKGRNNIAHYNCLSLLELDD